MTVHGRELARLCFLLASPNKNGSKVIKWTPLSMDVLYIGAVNINKCSPDDDAVFFFFFFPFECVLAVCQTTPCIPPPTVMDTDCVTHASMLEHGTNLLV